MVTALLILIVVLLTYVCRALWVIARNQREVAKGDHGQRQELYGQLKKITTAIDKHQGA